MKILRTFNQKINNKLVLLTILYKNESSCMKINMYLINAAKNFVL